jgi:threonine/homoserine/homoserine lactone efflux protein
MNANMIVILAALCFLIGALRNIAQTPGSPRFVDRIDWLCGGLFFLTLAYLARTGVV